jgi:predicted TIM-barrel fold metal-dependent hydrolase
VPVAGTGKPARKLARALNEYFGNITTQAKYNSRLGFFGVLPDWQDVNGTLPELDFLYQEQKLCNGVTVYTTYGDKLLDNPQFAPIWDRLQQYKALVFLHPGVLTVEPKFVASSLPQPIIDYPIATTRTAVDLVMTKTLRHCPDVDIILSHAGGTLPFVAERAIGSLAIPEVATMKGYDMLMAKQDFACFYYDLALSTSDAQLHGLLDFADPSHILFGSDFPYVPQFAINALVARYAAFVVTDSRGRRSLRGNSARIL